MDGGDDHETRYIVDKIHRVASQAGRHLIVIGGGLHGGQEHSFNASERQLWRAGSSFVRIETAPCGCLTVQVPTGSGIFDRC